MEPMKEKLMQVNLPGTTLFLDWRYSKLLVLYKVFCLVLDTFSLVLGVTSAVFISLYKVLIPNKPKDLEGALALVTGSGHGIGMELSVNLARLGATVICLDINETGNQETERRLQKVSGKYHMFVCDVSDKASVDRVSHEILENIGVPSLLINNAAITKRKTFLEHTQQELEELFSINVVGPMFLIKNFLPAMLQDPNNRHHIVGISSIVGMLGTPNMVPYSATKFAMTGFMEGLNYELMADKGKNMVLTTVHPFLVSSENNRKPSLRYEGLIGIVSVKEAAEAILTGIRREEREVYVPSSLHCLTRILRILPATAQTKLLEFIEFGSGP